VETHVHSTVGGVLAAVPHTPGDVGQCSRLRHRELSLSLSLSSSLPPSPSLSLSLCRVRALYREKGNARVVRRSYAETRT